MARKTWVQSQVESYQRLKKWYLMHPCLTLSIIRYESRVKWSNPGKGVAPSPTPWCSSYGKGESTGHPRLWSPTLTFTNSEINCKGTRFLNCQKIFTNCKGKKLPKKYKPKSNGSANSGTKLKGRKKIACRKVSSLASWIADKYFKQARSFPRK